MNKFPVKLRASAAAWCELEHCEFGSYEDHVDADDTRHGEYADGRLHIVEILQRQKHKTVVYLENQAEVDEFFAQAFTGTFGLVDG